MFKTGMRQSATVWNADKAAHKTQECNTRKWDVSQDWLLDPRKLQMLQSYKGYEAASQVLIDEEYSSENLILWENKKRLKLTRLSDQC